MRGKPFELWMRGVREGWTTQRDIEILKTVYRFRYVAGGDIATMFFPGSDPATVRRRLVKLYRRRILDRVRRWDPEGPSEYVYMVDDVGARYLAAALKTNVRDLKWEKRQHAVKLAYVQQYIAAMKFYLAIRKLVALRVFDPEKTLKYLDADGKERWFRPDAYMAFAAGKGKEEHRAFVEVDMGTEREQKIRQKVAGYRAFCDYRQKRHEGFTMPSILFVCEDGARLAKLKGWVEHARKDGGGRDDLKFLFWTFDGIGDGLRKM